MEKWQLGSELIDEPRGEFLEDDKIEEEKNKKKKLVKLIALMATKKTPKENWGKKSFTDELVEQQAAIQDKESSLKEERRLAELNNKKVIEVAKKFIVDRLDFAHQELREIPPGSEKESSIVQDVEILTRIKEVIDKEEELTDQDGLNEEEFIDNNEASTTSKSKEDYLLGGVVASSANKDPAKERSSSSHTPTSSTGSPFSTPPKVANTSIPKVVPPISQTYGGHTGSSSSPRIHTPKHIPDLAAASLASPSNHHNRPTQPSNIGHNQNVPSHRPDVRPTAPLHQLTANRFKPEAKPQPSYTVPKSINRFNQAPMKPKEFITVPPKRTNEGISKLPSIESLSYGQLLQEAEKVTVNNENLKNIYQTNKLGESALRRLLVEKREGHDLKKAINKEFVRKRINSEKLPWNRKKSGSVHGDSSGAHSLQTAAPMSDTHQQSMPKPQSLAQPVNKDSSKPDGSRKHSAFLTLIVIFFVVIILGIVLILKKN